MKIAQITHSYYPYIDGVAEHVRNISECLAQENEVTVITTDPSGKLQKEEFVQNVRILRFKSWAPGEAYHFSECLRKFLITNSFHFEVVHAHNYHAFPAFYAAQAKFGNKLVVTPHYHGAGNSFLRNLLHVPYRHFGNKIFQKADQVICVSNYERDLLLEHFKFNNSKTQVIPNGVNVTDFQGVRKYKKNYRIILFVGRLEKYKGAQDIIRVLPKMDEDVVIELVGKGSYKKVLLKLKSQLHLDNRVMFFKDLTRKELVQKYVDADLFVLLSEHESYGISVAEALAAGTPCIVANTSALSEWVDNRNVYGINNWKSSDELINCMKKVIGKNVVKPKFLSWNEVTHKIFKLYQ